MERIRLHDKYFKTLIPADEIQKHIALLAEKLNNDLKNEEKVLFISVLNGSFMFTSDLLKHIKVDCELAFVKLTSYHGAKSSGKVDNVMGLNTSIKGRSIVILEDIVDTGLTIQTLNELLLMQQPKSVKICTFLFKPDCYKGSLPVDYACMTIGADFVVGYGLDYDQLGRQLPDLYVLDE